MPTAPVNDRGTVLYYEDSGPVEGTGSYVTVVLFHGLIYHGGIFRHILPLAQSFGLRLVVVNWRDYPGSSPYSSSELEAFNGDYQTQTAIMEEQGRSIAAFLDYLIQSQKLPPLQVIDDKKTGGLSVLAWSLGTIFLFAFLAYAHRLEDSTKSLLEKYLRTAIVFDPPVKVLGRPIPERCYVPFADAAIKPEAMGEVFLVWVSTYYPPISDVENVTTSDIAADNRKPDLKRLPTILRMSPEERAATTDVSVLMRSAGLYLSRTHPDLFWQHFEGTMLDTKGVWPNVNAVLLWCDRGISECAWGAKVMADALKASDSRPAKRKADMFKIENANHLLHWDDPERMMQLLKEHA